MTLGFSALEREIKILQKLYELKCEQLRLAHTLLGADEGETMKSSREYRDLVHVEMFLLLHD
jgi:hypothetical protein